MLSIGIAAAVAVHPAEAHQVEAHAHPPAVRPVVEVQVSGLRQAAHQAVVFIRQTAALYSANQIIMALTDPVLATAVLYSIRQVLGMQGRGSIPTAALP